MAAIKKFFHDERSRKKRYEEERLRELDATANIYVVDQTKLDNAYQTLKQWRMLYEEDLLYYYQTLDQEEYEYVVGKKREFPSDVQEVLWGPPPLYTSANTLNIKCVDLTDKMYLDMKLSEQKELEKKVEEMMVRYTIPDRPRDILDDSVENLREQLQEQEKQLETIMKGPTKKYVAPSMRKQFMLSDPAVQELMKRIETTKNEIGVYEKSIVKANNDWTELQRFEIRQEIIKQMYAM